MYSLNNTTLNNDTANYCETPQTFYTFHEFFDCYGYFFRIKVFQALFGLFISVGTIVANFLVIYYLLLKPKISIFDQIIIGHALVDGITGVVDIPFFHVNDIMGYWPFGYMLASLWSSYDNNINITTSMHMLYMGYVRLRSIQSPRGYLNEFLCKKPKLVMLFFWALGLGFYTPVSFLFGVYDYSYNVMYTPDYLGSVFNIFTWLLPMLGNLVVSIEVMRQLKLRNKKKQIVAAVSKFVIASTRQNTTINTEDDEFDEVAPKKSSSKNILSFFMTLKPTTKFQIITFSYWFQWIIPCVLTVLLPCDCIPNNWYIGIYWLTYTVCFTDPCIVLLLNPNVTRKRQS